MSVPFGVIGPFALVVVRSQYGAYLARSLGEQRASCSSTSSAEMAVRGVAHKLLGRDRIHTAHQISEADGVSVFEVWDRGPILPAPTDGGAD